MPPKDKVINLRGHHLLCVRTFSGAGYSKGFVENMQMVVDACKNSHRSVKIVDGLDDICVSCPHSNGNQCCKDGGSVLEMDKEALSIFGIEANTEYRSALLFDKIEKVVHDDLFHSICSHCEWFIPFCHPLLCKDQ